MISPASCSIAFPFMSLDKIAGLSKALELGREPPTLFGSDIAREKRQIEREDRGRERANKTSRVKWGEENERQMANNVMREIGIVMGTWYMTFCVDSPATAPEILLAMS